VPVSSIFLCMDLMVRVETPHHGRCKTYLECRCQPRSRRSDFVVVVLLVGSLVKELMSRVYVVEIVVDVHRVVNVPGCLLIR
jgi:hypothetical protein